MYPDPPDRQRFARAQVTEAAARLAAIIRAEHADLLLSYDAHGGYGHRDHVQVHRVGALAAAATGVAVLEATAPRELVSVLVLVRGLRKEAAGIRYTPRADISHRIDVRRYSRQKRAALAAHRSQYSGRGPARRLPRLLVILPVPLFGLLFGREWFAEPAAEQ